MSQYRITDQQMQRVIGNVLRYGVFTSAAIVIVGSIIFLLHHGRQIADYHNFSGNLSPFRSVADIWSGVCQGEGIAIIQMGVAVLLATPIVRVLCSAISFLLEKDYLYVLITFIVLAIITFSMLYKLAG